MASMDIAVMTFDGFNEIDSFVALHILGRLSGPDWRVHLAAPEPTVTSMNGVTVTASCSLDDALQMDAVLIGSGKKTRQLAADSSLMAQLQIDPTRQLVGSQCSGALVLAALGLLDGVQACTDQATRQSLLDAGVEVLDVPFHASGNLATAGGCLSSVYLATWIIAHLVSQDAARNALHFVAPVGEADSFVEHAIDVACATMPLSL